MNEKTKKRAIEMLRVEMRIVNAQLSLAKDHEFALKVLADTANLHIDRLKKQAADLQIRADLLFSKTNKTNKTTND